MNSEFVVRVRPNDPENIDNIIQTVKKLDGFLDFELRNEHLLIRFVSEINLNNVLIQLQNCLKEVDGDQDDNWLGEIVETSFTDKYEKTQLPEDIIIESAFSFGSGSHPSTRLAMNLLGKISESNISGQVLDVGCGSGILALLAARYGADYVLGVEIDPESVITARENVEANNLSDRVDISDRSLSEIEGMFDLILANLTASVFYQLEEDIFRLAADNSRLIISGLLGRQGEEIAARLEAKGWLCQGRESEGKWRALLMARKYKGGRLS